MSLFAAFGTFTHSLGLGGLLRMASMRSSGRSRSTLFEDEACISRDGDRTRSQLLEKSGLHKTSKASKNLASTKHDSSSRSKAESDNQETTKSVRSTPDQCALVSSLRKSKTVHIPRIWDELPAWRLEYEALTGIQQQVMEYVASNSEAESAAAKARLQKSWAVFNISDQDFSKIELYLAKKVPLTIRVDIQGLFPYLIHDPFYRTCFETNIKGSAYLEARREFEAVLFNNLYEHPSVQPQDRPKYGVLNMVCHPFSDSRVSSFGSAYLLLKDSLRVSKNSVLALVCGHALESRARTTVATSKENLGFRTRRVGTLDHMWHIVETLSNHEITRIHAVATGIRAKATVSPDSKYSEIQIHGMIDVRKDVAAIVVQRKDLESNRTGPLIQELSKRYILPVLTCEELDENLGDRRWSTVINQRANYLLQKTMAMHDATYSTCKWSV